MHTQDFSRTWLNIINDTIANGTLVTLDGMRAKEVPQRTLTIDMRRPVLCIPNRSLSYNYMAAQAFFTLSPADGAHSENYDFSDYGPRVAAKLSDIVENLSQDKESMQAGVTVWRGCTPNLKYIPCTVAIFFNIRQGMLNVNVFMQSNDVWLSLPYDVFNFSMLGHSVCALLNEQLPSNQAVSPGQLFITATSNHLYEINWSDAKSCMNARILEQPRTDKLLWNDHHHLVSELDKLRGVQPNNQHRWWEGYETKS